MLKLWGMLSTPSLPSLSGPLWPGVVAPDCVLSMAQIVWHLIKPMTYDLLLEMEQFDNLTMSKQMTDI